MGDCGDNGDDKYQPGRGNCAPGGFGGGPGQRDKLACVRHRHGRPDRGRRNGHLGVCVVQGFGIFWQGNDGGFIRVFHDGWFYVGNANRSGGERGGIPADGLRRLSAGQPGGRGHGAHPALVGGGNSVYVRGGGADLFPVYYQARCRPERRFQKDGRSGFLLEMRRYPLRRDRGAGPEL